MSIKSPKASTGSEIEFTKTSFVKPQLPHFTVAKAPFFLISVTLTGPLPD